MNLPTSIRSLLKFQNGTITSRDIATIGISRTMLSNYVRAGLLEKASRGVYVTPSSIPDELFSISKRTHHIVFSHETAAFLLGISERTPFNHTVTIRSSQTISSALRVGLTCFYIKDDTYTLGLSQATTQFGNTVPCYDLERTVCDMIRDRPRIDDETFLTTIRNYSRSRKHDIVRLSFYAEKMNLTKKVASIMEFVL